MDYATAHQFLLAQGTEFEQIPDSFLSRLRQGQPPIPGQVTSMLLALKVTFEALKSTRQLDREFVYALYMLAHDSRYQYDQGLRRGVVWPPLDEDLDRIAKAVRSIFADVWEP